MCLSESMIRYTWASYLLSLSKSKAAKCFTTESVVQDQLYQLIPADLSGEIKEASRPLSLTLQFKVSRCLALLRGGESAHVCIHL